MASGPNTKSSIDRLLSDTLTRITLLERRLAIGGGGGSGGSSVSAGMIQPFAGVSAPPGWLVCDGAAVSRTTYAELFNAVGTTYGTGDGSTTFNLPDLRGRVPVGRDATQTEFDVLGEAGGSKTHFHYEGDLAAAIGASNGDINSLTYETVGRHIRGPASWGPYTVFGNGAPTSATRSFNHYTKVYGQVESSSSLAPYRVLNFIIATASGSGLQPQMLTNQGTTAARNSIFGTPTTAAQRAALANQMVQWYNTDTARWETYYAVSGTAGLTVPGLHTSGFSAGWYVAPSYDWGSKGGPSTLSAIYRNVWAKGVDAGSVIDAHSATDGIIIGISGVYECVAVQRGGPSSTSGSDYIGLAINGDRAAMENRANGMYTHDHSAGNNLFSNTRYIGALTAGEKITAGAPSTSNALLYGTEPHRGMMQVRRIS